MQFNEKRTLDQLFEMIRIDSINYHEGPMTDYLQKYFEDLGYEVYRDEACKAFGGDHGGNLIVHIPGTIEGEAICLNAHQDTMEPGIGIEPYYENGIVRSKGDTILAADDKSGIAMMIELLHVLKETNTPHRDLYFLFTVGEEYGMLGAKNLDYTKIPTKNIFSLDAAGELGQLTTSGAGKDELVATFHGRMAHGGIEPEKGISAIAMLASAINRVHFGRINEETTSNLGLIDGGIANNVVCDKARFTCEVRSQSQDQIDAQIQLICKACEDAAAEFGGTVELDINHFCPPLKADPDCFIMKKTADALRAEGIEPKFTICGGSGDVNIFSGHGFECTGISTGMFEVHTPDEYLDMKIFAQAFRVLWRIVTN